MSIHLGLKAFITEIKWLSFACCAAAGLFYVLPATAQTFEAGTISIQDFTGHVEIKTATARQSDNSIRVDIRQGSTEHEVLTGMDGDVLVISGEPWKVEDEKNCCNYRINRTVNTRKDRTVTTGQPVDEDLFKQYPTLTVTLPKKTDVIFIDTRMKLAMEDLDGKLDLHGCYVYGRTGNIDEAVVGLIDGSRLYMGDILSGIEVDISGDADLKLGTVSIADVDIAGPGDVVFDRVEGILDISIAGSGLVRSDWVEGPMTVRVAGSGGAAVKDGRIDKLRAIVDGSGGIMFNGVAKDPDLRLYGSSEVRLARIEGRVVHHGSGQLFVGGELRENR